MPTTTQRLLCQTCQCHYDTPAIIPTNKVNNRKNRMERTIVNVSIEQVADNGNASEIKVLASRNGLPVFSEEFKSTEKPPGVHLYQSRDMESYDTERSASLASISALAATISSSVKTSGKVFEEGSDELCRVKHVIREFEKLANVRFDYNRFKCVAYRHRDFSRCKSSSDAESFCRFLLDCQTKPLTLQPYV